MNIELTPAEHEYLLEVLRDELGRLKAEINRTETVDFKAELKRREVILRDLLERLDAAEAGDAVASG